MKNLRYNICLIILAPRTKVQKKNSPRHTHSEFLQYYMCINNFNFTIIAKQSNDSYHMRQWYTSPMADLSSKTAKIFLAVVSDILFRASHVLLPICGRIIQLSSDTNG